MANTPAGTHDFVYPSMIERLEGASIDKALSEANGEISNPIVRDVIPEIDLDTGADTSWDGEAAGWDVSPDTDGPGTYEVFEVDSDTGKAERRVTTFYGFEAVEGAEYVEQINFLGSDGQVFERAKVTGLDETGDTAVDRQKTLRSPISFDVQDNGTIELVVNEDYTETDDTIKLKFLGVTAEKTGRRVGTRT